MFEQECPVCGRPVQILWQHRKHSVICTHCRGNFVAGAEQVGSAFLLQRADELLEAVVRRLHGEVADTVGTYSGPAALRKVSA